MVPVGTPNKEGQRLGHEDILEYDDGEFYGWLGLHIFGHVDDETAVAYTWAEMIDYGHDYALAQPRRLWVRKVPRETGHSYVYARQPGRGAYPVTVVETAHGWRYWCDKAGCENAYVPGAAKSGVHASGFENVENWFGRTRPRPQDERQPDYWYVCRRHMIEYDDALRSARAAALAAYYASKEAS